MRSIALAVTFATAVTLPVEAQVEYELDGSLWGRFESRSIDEGVNSNFTWLQTRIGAPLLSVDRVVLAEGRCVERVHTYYRGDLYSLAIHFDR